MAIADEKLDVRIANGKVRSMTALMMEIERKASRLSPEERELLAERLLASLTETPLTAVDEMWIEEAERRYSGWKAGRSKGVAAERALAGVRKELP